MIQPQLEEDKAPQGVGYTDSQPGVVAAPGGLRPGFTSTLSFFRAREHKGKGDLVPRVLETWVQLIANLLHGFGKVTLCLTSPSVKWA